jgi:hypothetical protein
MPKNIKGQLAFFCFSLGLAALTLGASVTHASGIDSRYKFNRALPNSTKVTANSLAVLYKGFFAHSMASDCPWYPSDSRYMALMAKRCGELRGSMMAMGRFLNEPNANEIASSVILNKNKLRFVDFGDSCDMF